jgi:hypothetical protein
MKFTAKKHNEKYHYYCEVVITPKGRVLYARPSHCEVLIKIACKKLKCTRDELCNMCPPCAQFTWLDWLCYTTGCIAVWYEGYTWYPNDKQKDTLKYLIRNKCVDFNIKEYTESQMLRDIQFLKGE